MPMRMVHPRRGSLNELLPPKISIRCLRYFVAKFQNLEDYAKRHTSRQRKTPRTVPATSLGTQTPHSASAIWPRLQSQSLVPIMQARTSYKGLIDGLCAVGLCMASIVACSRRECRDAQRALVANAYASFFTDYADLLHTVGVAPARAMKTLICEQAEVVHFRSLHSRIQDV